MLLSYLEFMFFVGLSRTLHHSPSTYGEEVKGMLGMAGFYLGYLVWLEGLVLSRYLSEHVKFSFIYIV